MSVASQLGVLLLRLWVGLNFAFVHGLEKVQDPELFLESADVRSFPWHRTLGWCAIAAEFFGGLLMIAGLKTRVAAGALLVTMLSAAYVVHGGSPWSDKELPLTYAMVLLLFVLHGGGAASADDWLERRRRKASPW